jgi:hypothetical protein
MKYIIIIFICLCIAVIIFSLCAVAGNADEKIEKMMKQNDIKKTSEMNMKNGENCKNEDRKYS